jgi:hypothetical protein
MSDKLISWQFLDATICLRESRPEADVPQLVSQRLGTAEDRRVARVSKKVAGT